MIPGKKTRDEWRRLTLNGTPLALGDVLELLIAVGTLEAQMESMRRAVEKFIQQGHAAGRLAADIETGYADLLKRPS